jgi:hypothetical protein
MAYCNLLQEGSVCAASLGSPGVTSGPKLDSTTARLRKGSVRVGFEVELLRPVRVGFIKVRGLGEPFPLGSG